MVSINDQIGDPTHTTNVSRMWKTTSQEWPNGRQSVRREWALPLNKFRVEWDGINLTELQTLRAFFDSRFGAYLTFDFTDPHENVTYVVRFDQDSFTRRMVRKNTRGLYKIKLKFVEVKT